MRAHNSIPVDSESLDEVLMSAFADGDRSAFDTLYSRHQVALLRFVRRMMGQRLAGESQEVLRQIWLRIVEERDEFGSANTSWRCWAFRIARGITLERLRLTGRDADYHGHDEDGDGLEAARMFGRLLREGADPEDDGGRSEEEEAFWRAAGRRLLTCLEELPDDERAAFLLRQQEDFGIGELAYMLGVEEDGVRKRLRRALGKLRGCMERYLSVLGATPAEDESEAAQADDEQLRDPYLDEALASAPDVGAVLDWRVGKALLEQAHQSLLGSADPDLDDLDGTPSGGRGLRYGVIALVLVAAAGAWYWLQQPGRQLRVESVAGGAASPAAVEPPAAAAPAPRSESALVAKADSRPAAASESVPLIPELQALFAPKRPAADGAAAAPDSAPAKSRAATPAAAPASPPAAAPSASSRVAAAAAAAAAASSSTATRAAPSASGASNAASGPAQAPTRNAATPASAAAIVPPPTAPSAAAPAAPTSRGTAVAAATPPAAAPAAVAAPESLKPLAPATPSGRQAAASQAVARVQPDPPPSIPPAKPAAPVQTAAQATQPATQLATRATTQAKTEAKSEVAAQAKAEPTTKPKTEAAPPLPPPNAQAVATADRPRPVAPGAAAQSAGTGNASTPIPPVAAAPPAANPAASASSSTVRTDDTPPPTFDALSQWSRITITRRDGTTRTLTRAEAGDLNSLLGSAAIAAVGSKPLGGSPEWRATLERPNGEVLAVFEVASTSVRWREGRTPPATGIPSGLALAGLREAMSDAVRPPRPAQPARPIATEAAASKAETAPPAPQEAGDKP